MGLTDMHLYLWKLVWNSPSNRAELARIASSTSGLHTLSVAKLKRIMLRSAALVSGAWSGGAT